MKNILGTIKENRRLKTLSGVSAIFLLSIALFGGMALSVKAQDYVYSIRPILRALDVQVHEVDADNIRNGAIAYLSSNTQYSVQYYQGQPNSELLETLTYVFYLQFRGAPVTYIKTLTKDDLRNTTITIVNKRVGTPVAQLQGMQGTFILLQDKVNFARLEEIFQTKPREERFNFRPTSTECTDIRNAKNSLPGLANHVQQLKNDYNDALRALNDILNVIRKIPFVSLVFDKVANANPIYRELEAKRKEKWQAIVNAENEYAVANKIAMDPDKNSKCSQCNQDRDIKVAAVAELNNHPTYFESMRSYRNNLISSATVNLPLDQQKTPNSDFQAFLNQIEDWDNDLWLKNRNNWLTKNDSIPQCN